MTNNSTMDTSTATGSETAGYPHWEFLDCDGDAPPSRSGHTCALYQDRYLYVFGGFDGTNCFDDLWCLDLESKKWEKLEAKGDLPSGRASHSVATDDVQGVMYIFGGSGAHFGYTNKCDLYAFHFATQTWQLLWNPVDDTPSARYGQSMVVYNEGLYVWGGTHGTNYPTDMHRFDLCGKQWQYIMTTGDLPCGRYRHQAMVKGDEMLVVGGSGINRYGDVYSFTFNDSTWAKVQCTGADLSDGRYAHSAVLRENNVYLYGGNDGVRHDDLLQLDLVNNVWSRVEVCGAAPPPRDFHAAVLRNNSMVVFGGSSGMRRHNDCCELRLAPRMPKCTMAEDLLSMLQQCQVDEKYQTHCADVCLYSPNEPNIGLFCHSHILQVRCPQVYQLVEQTKQNINNDAHPLRVEVPFVKTRAVLTSLLEYIYGEVVSAKLSSLECYELYMVARQANMERLAVMCQRQLRICMSVENVLPLMRATIQDVNGGELERNAPAARDILEACKHFFLYNYQECTQLDECEILDPKVLCELMRLHNKGGIGKTTGGYVSSPTIARAGGGGEQNVIQGAAGVGELSALELPDSSFNKDIYRLFADALHPDFTVEVQDLEMKVHKCILVARCTYFGSCITSGMKESYTNSLKIDDGSVMTAPAFQAFMHFIYGGAGAMEELSPENAMYLVEACQFYGLSSSLLKHICESRVKESFNEAHVLKIFEASSTLQQQAVRSMALEFIVENFDRIGKQVALETLEKPMLLEILRGLAERPVYQNVVRGDSIGRGPHDLQTGEPYVAEPNN